MKKLFLAMLTLGIAGAASAQSYGHNQPQPVYHESYNTHESRQTNAHNYGNAPANNHGQNTVVVVKNAGSHNNSNYGYPQPVYGMDRGHQSNTVIVSNRHERRELAHARKDARRYGY